ncbi:hypothetical protein pb186bvf_020609 [Paramecium bursaria]
MNPQKQQPNFQIRKTKTTIVSVGKNEQLQKIERIDKQDYKSSQFDQLKKENDFLRSELIAAQDQIQILMQENKRLRRHQQQIQIPPEILMAYQMQNNQYYEFMQEAMRPQTQFETDNMSYEQLLQLQEQVGHVSRGLTKEQIKKITKIVKKQQFQFTEECTICCSEIRIHERVRQLKCKHYYHAKCIKKWLLNEKKCPICKIEL